MPWQTEGHGLARASEVLPSLPPVHSLPSACPEVKPSTLALLFLGRAWSYLGSCSVGRDIQILPSPPQSCPKVEAYYWGCYPNASEHWQEWDGCSPWLSKVWCCSACTYMHIVCVCVGTCTLLLVLLAMHTPGGFGVLLFNFMLLMGLFCEYSLSWCSSWPAFLTRTTFNWTRTTFWTSMGTYGSLLKIKPTHVTAVKNEILQVYHSSSPRLLNWKQCIKRCFLLKNPHEIQKKVLRCFRSRRRKLVFTKQDAVLWQWPAGTRVLLKYTLYPSVVL